MEPQGDIALIGLAVMGRNLILNMNDRGFTVVAYNRTLSRVDDFMANEAKGTKVIGARSVPEMIAHLKQPRRVMMLVKAGQPVDEFIEKLAAFARGLRIGHGLDEGTDLGPLINAVQTEKVDGYIAKGKA